ncbi:MAG: CHASE2 domain-containing protein [Candidatus Zixiibacteriota bacterium]|nr:MAG: CHASE2 domain-containing protein [candidate division Zixibacteria bacterium]
MMRKFSSYVLCLLIAILVVTLYVNDFSPLVALEWKLQDMLYSFRGEQAYHSDIVLVNIDDRSLKEYGAWPWKRDKIADLLAAIGSAEPKTVVLDIVFVPDIDEDTAGYTQILADQMSWINSVILPYEISRAEFRTSRISIPKYLYPFSIQVDADLGILDERGSLLAHRVFLPPRELCEYSRGLGFKYATFDIDRQLRWQPLAIYFEGYYYPSIALMAAADYLDVSPDAITVYGGKKIGLGAREIPINKETQLFINFNQPTGAFQQVSAADVLSEALDFDHFKNKLVLISLASEQLCESYRTPVSPRLRSSLKTANVIENIIHSSFIKRYDSSSGTDMLILFALGAIFAFILPRVSLSYRMIILTVSLFILANLTFVLFNSYSIQIRFLYIGLELLLLLMASPILDDKILSRFTEMNIGRSKSAGLPKISDDESLAARPRKILQPPSAVPETTEMERQPLGVESSPLRQTPASEAVAEQPTVVMAREKTSMDSEKTKAMSDEIPAEAGPAPPDTQSRASSQSVEYNQVLFEEDKPAEPQSPLQDSGKTLSGSDGILVKNLGRYQVLDVLGKGAMGTVYKGVDPAIDRNVALKTIRLDFVNDTEELEELKERLFREAQAAGKLSHPNIVTIYDVGTEQNLQYIAMEFLEGQTLEDMIRRKVKFNYRIIAQIITQICQALTYAHSQGIVHRDIKPANIMVLSDYTVKVMDFGIARLDSSSMTRTGIAMGTPNYISPEQLQGKPVDNRTDIFSLGVMMYEMLVYRRPFRGENLTTLIYNIVNAAPLPPSTIDNSVPHLFDRVVEKALQKNPEERYQKASEIAASLADFIDSFSAKRSTVV